jgi:CheY-like chemotaxis protein
MMGSEPGVRAFTGVAAGHSPSDERPTPGTAASGSGPPSPPKGRRPRLELDLGVERYQQLLEAFIEGLPGQAAELRAAAALHDVATIRDVAGAIAETAPAFDEVRLTGLARHLYECATTVLRNEDLVRLIADLDREVVRLHIAQRPSGLILVAEDNVVSQRVASAMLDNLGFRVHVVADGQQAVTAARATSYDAILMDSQMPVMDGDRAATEIRQQQVGGRRVPIVAVSASSTRSDRQRCLAAGMDDLIEKPVTLRALAAVMARWVPDAEVGATTAHDRPDVPPDLADDTVIAHPTGPGPPDEADPSIDLPVLDEQVLQRLERLGRSSGQDVLGQVTELFLTEARSLLQTLGVAFADGDHHDITTAAHALRGASANIGADDLAALCATIERIGTSQGTAPLAVLELEVQRTRDALDVRLGAPKAARP